MPTTIRRIPFNHFAVVAAAGLVGFLALWQGIFSLIDYRPCAISNPSYVLSPNVNAAITQLSISAVALCVLFIGARKLRSNFGNEGFFGYSLVVVNLLIGEGLLAFIFVRLSSVCAG